MSILDKSPYPAALMAEAQRLYAGGWSPSEIQRLFEARGEQRIPSRTTIRVWGDEEFRERQLVSHRAAHHRRAEQRGRSFRLAADTPEFQAAFVRRLREEGEPVSGLVRVCRVVFGGKWTRGRVLRLLAEVES